MTKWNRTSQRISRRERVSVIDGLTMPQFVCQFLTMCLLMGLLRPPFILFISSGRETLCRFIILVSKLLSRMLSSNLNNGNHLGYKIKQSCPTISHVPFVYDSLLFEKASMFERTRLLYILQRYYLASSINIQKSSLFLVLIILFSLKAIFQCLLPSAQQVHQKNPWVSHLLGVDPSQRL